MKMKNWLIAFVALFVVTGCTQSSVPVQNLPEITFKHLKPIALDVAVIDVVDQSSDGMGGKHVEHLFPTAPKTAVHNWVRDRLVATGASGSARVIINDASALEEKLKRTSGIKGVFTNDQSERYTTNVDVRIELFDAANTPTGFASAKATRSKTFAEDFTLLEREKAWFDLVEQMMADFDRVMVENMKARLKLK